MTPHRRDVLFGALAVLIGHAFVLAAGKLVDGPDPVIYYSAISVLLLGVIQLVYVIPLLGYGLWRRRSFAIGTAGMAAGTLIFSAVGLLH